MKKAQWGQPASELYSAYEGHYVSWEQVVFDSPDVVASFSEKRPEDDLSAPWLFWNDEVWYVISGSLSVEYLSPPYFNERHHMMLGSGDAVYVPTGTQVYLSVVGDVPFRFFWVAMPRPKHFGSDGF